MINRALRIQAHRPPPPRHSDLSSKKVAILRNKTKTMGNSRHTVCQHNVPTPGDILEVDLVETSELFFNKIVPRGLISVQSASKKRGGLVAATWRYRLPPGVRVDPVYRGIHVVGGVMEADGTVNCGFLRMKAVNRTLAWREFWAALLIQRVYRMRLWKRRNAVVMGELRSLPGSCDFIEAKERWEGNAGRLREMKRILAVAQ